LLSVVDDFGYGVFIVTVSIREPSCEWRKSWKQGKYEVWLRPMLFHKKLAVFLIRETSVKPPKNHDNFEAIFDQQASQAR